MDTIACAKLSRGDTQMILHYSFVQLQVLTYLVGGLPVRKQSEDLQLDKIERTRFHGSPLAEPGSLFSFAVVRFSRSIWAEGIRGARFLNAN
jgi:hypothetical protein